MLPAIVWFLIFVLALVALVKGSDWLVLGAERISLAMGMTPFVAGVVFVGIGTSFPELISSLAGVSKGVTEIVAANAVGSNIANILLVLGISAVVGRTLVVDKDLIDLDLPLIATSTILFVGVAYDGVVTPIEAVLLFSAFFIHLGYTIFNQQELTDMKKLPVKLTRRVLQGIAHGGYKIPANPKMMLRDVGYIVLGAAVLSVGAKYLIDSVLALSDIFGISAGAITIIAVAVGTSLPELIVSAKAAMHGKSEIALGNIFGSNAFNILVVVGLPGMFTNLHLDAATLYIGVPTMVLVTFLFVFSGISRRIHSWEGGLYIIGYIIFTGKIFNLF